jgi:CheY-like chemotaxis protein
MDAEHLKRILVVDDEADVTELLDYKFSPVPATPSARLNDPLRAIGLARDFRPDLIILDVMMPELTGVAAAAHGAGRRPAAGHAGDLPDRARPRPPTRSKDSRAAPTTTCEAVRLRES